MSGQQDVSNLSTLASAVDRGADRLREHLEKFEGGITEEGEIIVGIRLLYEEAFAEQLDEIAAAAEREGKRPPAEDIREAPRPPRRQAPAPRDLPRLPRPEGLDRDRPTLDLRQARLDERPADPEQDRRPASGGGLMEVYTSGTGRKTERIRVDLTPEEARALASLADMTEKVVGPSDGGPQLNGLRRIRSAYRIEEGQQ